jgi:hypothetical protein
VRLEVVLIIHPFLRLAQAGLAILNLEPYTIGRSRSPGWTRLRERGLALDIWSRSVDLDLERWQFGDGGRVVEWVG